MTKYDKSTLYDQELLEECSIENPDALPKVFRGFYATIMPLFYAVDRHLVEQTEYGLPDHIPPECYIPPMRYNDEPVDGRTVHDREINYENGQWHVIYSDRGKEVERYTFNTVDELVYYFLNRYIGAQTYSIVLKNPALKKGGKEGDHGDTLTAAGKIGIPVMQAVKPEWTERYRQGAIAELKRFVAHTPEQVKELETFDPQHGQ